MKTNLRVPRFLYGLAALIFPWGMPQISNAQWVAYTFSPRAAYLSSYGLTGPTNSFTNSPANNLNATNISTNGWPTSWSNSAARGILAVFYSTNTSGPNTFVCLPPLVYTSTTTTNQLTTNNYQTNLWYLFPTNTNATGLNSFSNVARFVRTFLSNDPYMAAQYSLNLTNASTNIATNVVGTFNAVSIRFGTTTATNTLGTNGVPTNGTAIYPAILPLRISTLVGMVSTNGGTNQQLSLSLTINTQLTRIMNTNTNFGPNALTNFTTSGAMYTNLVRLIRSNGTFINF